MAEPVKLFPALWLYYMECGEPTPTLPAGHTHTLICCREGHAHVERRDGASRTITAGELAFCERQPDSASAPEGHFSGVILSLHLPELIENPPDFAAGTELFKLLAARAELAEGGVLVMPGGEEAEAALAGFYDKPPELLLLHQRLAALRLLVAVQSARPPAVSAAAQAELIRAIHDELLQNMGRRITIDELSRRYLVNPTSLKSAFKEVYGTSLAAHMRQHRLEEAARLLRETDLSITEIAEAISYQSPSRFTAAFKAEYHLLPREYRRANAATHPCGED